jgi:hypothetical protein
MMDRREALLLIERLKRRTRDPDVLALCEHFEHERVNAVAFRRPDDVTSNICSVYNMPRLRCAADGDDGATETMAPWPTSAPLGGFFLPQGQSTFYQRQRDATSSGNRQIQLLRPRRRTRQAPTDRAARFIDDRSHSVSGRFSISATRGQHHVPSSTLSASCVTRKHRAAWR